MLGEAVEQGDGLQENVKQTKEEMDLGESCYFNISL